MALFKNLGRKPQNPDGSPSKPSVSIPWKKIFWTSIIVLVIVFVVIYFALKLFGMGQRISERWEEIRFAYEKPMLVRSIRTDYEQREKDLDASFLKRQQTAQEKLLEEVANKLKSSSLK